MDKLNSVNLSSKTHRRVCRCDLGQRFVVEGKGSEGLEPQPDSARRCKYGTTYPRVTSVHLSMCGICPFMHVWHLSTYPCVASVHLSTCGVCPATVNQPRLIHVWCLSRHSQPAKGGGTCNPRGTAKCHNS